MLYLKIINTWKIIYASYSKLPKELKNGIEILAGQAFFKLWIKAIKMLFGSIIQEPLGLPKFWYYFLVPLTIYYKMHTLFIKKSVDNFEIEHENANFGVGGAVLP